MFIVSLAHGRLGCIIDIAQVKKIEIVFVGCCCSFQTSLRRKRRGGSPLAKTALRGLFLLQTAAATAAHPAIR